MTFHLLRSSTWLRWTIVRLYELRGQLRIVFENVLVKYLEPNRSSWNPHLATKQYSKETISFFFRIPLDTRWSEPQSRLLGIQLDSHMLKLPLSAFPLSSFWTPTSLSNFSYSFVTLEHESKSLNSHLLVSAANEPPPSAPSLTLLLMTKSLSTLYPPNPLIEVTEIRRSILVLVELGVEEGGGWEEEEAQERV